MPIVTDGLIGYWHYQQDVSGSTWGNISPTPSIGALNLGGASLQSDGVYADGIDDKIAVNVIESQAIKTIEMIFRVPQITAQMTLFGYDGKILIYANINTTFKGFSLGVTERMVGELQPNADTIITGVYLSNGYKFYVNGQLLDTYTGSILNNTDSAKKLILFHIGNLHTSGYVKALRIYNKELTISEISQNYAVGTAIGLDKEPPPQEPPKPTIINISRTTISDEPTMDIATVTFTFDQDVTEWRVRTIGTDHDTGILADSGGAVSAGTEITAEVDYTELYGEGQNRVNIYGKNADGQWTPYT